MDNKADLTTNEFFLNMDKQARTGEIIVKVIVICSYVFLVTDFIFSIIMGTFSFFSIIKLIIWAIFYEKLYIGRAWAKWLYIISCAIGIILLAVLYSQLSERHLLGALSAGMARRPDLAVMLWISLSMCAVDIVFCILLIGSKSVKEFLYRQMAGE